MAAQVGQAPRSLQQYLVAETRVPGERDAAVVEASVRQGIEAAGGRVDYVAIVDPDELTPLLRLDQPARAIVAAWFGPARLLDNVALAG